MQLRYVFSELGQGLRRNLSMHVAVILTLFVSLTLVGFGFLLNEQAKRAGEHWGNELQITVFLCRDGDDNPACPTEVTPAQQQAVEDVLDRNPEVSTWYVESKEEAFEKVKELFGSERFEGRNAAATADDMAVSLWVTLNDPDEYEGVTSEVRTMPGVGSVRDQRAIVTPILEGIDKMKLGAWLTSIFLVLAALLLVANTIRLTALARRKEIGIMRLVGASTLYIALPFLLEAILTALLGVTLAGSAMGAFMYFAVDQGLAVSVGFIPWIGMQEFLFALVIVAALGPALTLLPTLVLTRKYLKV